MHTINQAFEILIPGNWCEERARELLEELAVELEAMEELQAFDFEGLAATEWEQHDERDNNECRAETYDKLVSCDDPPEMTIGGVPVIWEILEAARPTGRTLRRVTVWIDEDTWNEHVELHQEEEDEDG